MTLRELANRGQSQGFRIVEDQIVGIHKGYAFQITMKSKTEKDTIYIRVQVEGSVPGKVRKGIKGRLPKKTQVIWSANLPLTVILTTDSTQDIYNITVDALNAIAENLSSAKRPINNPKKCAVCKKEDCDSAALVGGSFVRVHRQCVEEENRKEVESADQNQLSGSHITGLIGAILGAIVGCIPSLFTICFLEYEFGLLFAAIPIASFYGYKLFKGRRGAGAAVLVSLASLAAFTIMNPTVWFFLELMSRGYGFWETVVIYYTELSLPDILSEIWFRAIFIIVGIVGGFKMMSTTNEERISAAKTTAESIIPLNSAAKAGLFDNSGRVESPDRNADPWLR